MILELLDQAVDDILVVREHHHRLASLQQVINKFGSWLDLAHAAFAHDLGQPLESHDGVRVGNQRISVEGLLLLVDRKVEGDQ